MNSYRRMPALVASLSLAFLLPVAMAGEEALQDRLLRCAALPAESERVKCYDALAETEAPTAETGATGSNGETGAVDNAPAQPAPAVEPEPAQPTEITDEVGREQVDRTDDAGKVEYRARVTQCRKNSSGRVFFYLGNGQIWKQTDYSRVRFRECDFDVTLTRDAFGYKMKIVDRKASYRVSRVN